MSRRAFAYLSTVVATIGLAAGSASAGPSPTTGPMWSGFYVGGHVGYGTGADTGCGAWNGGMTMLPVSHAADCSANPNDPNNHNYSIYGPFKGWLGGLQVGDNFQFGSFVIGAEFAASLSGLEHSNTSPLVTEKTGPLVTATLHAGFAPGPLYFYGLVGFGAATQTHDDNTSNCHWSIGVGGPVYGAGIQTKVGSKVSLFGEWNRLAFNETSATCYNGSVNTNNLVKTNADIFKVGVNFQIN
ncbi:MAG TPA: outer membrane beta-barrel protein [Bauldia sp.]|nr:outer membrane beta-barrel protein [Bauldia sp.]